MAVIASMSRHTERAENFIVGEGTGHSDTAAVDGLVVAEVVLLADEDEPNLGCGGLC